MAYATGAQRYLAYIRESVFGTVPSTPTLVKLRNTGGNGIVNERAALESGEIRDDRGIADFTLGQNQPALQVPVELSYASYDDFLMGVMGQAWKGGITLTDVTVDIAGAVVTHNSGTNWTTLGLAEGDYIVISGCATAADDGVYYILDLTGAAMTLEQADGTTDASFTTAVDDVITIRSGFIGGRIAANTNNITVAGTAKTYTAASSVWKTIGLKGISKGDLIYLDGFATAGNNGWKKVASVTTTVLTVEQTCTNETLASGNLDIGSGIGVLLSATTSDIPSFTVEEGFTDITQFHHVSGAKVGTFSLSCQPGSKITGSFSLVGAIYSALTGTSIATALTASNDNDTFNAYRGDLGISSGSITEETGVISGINLQIENSLNRRYALMQENASAIGEGRVKVTGSINAFFTNATLAGLYANQTEFDVYLRLLDLSNNSYTILLPRIKFTKDGRSISENDVTQALDFQALIDEDSVTAMIIKQPAA